jgi:hypothetical protein
MDTETKKTINRVAYVIGGDGRLRVKKGDDGNPVFIQFTMDGEAKKPALSVLDVEARMSEQ